MVRRKLKIGFDLDGVLDQDWYGRLEQWLKCESGLDTAAIQSLPGSGLGLQSVHIEETIGCTPEEAGELVRRFMASGSGFFPGIRPGALAAVRAINRWADPWTVTSREVQWKDQTEAWLAKCYEGHFVLERTLWTNYLFDDQPKLTKAEVCQAHGILIIVDDRPDYVLECVESGMCAVLFGELPWTVREWDRWLSARRGNPPPRIDRALSWDELPAAINRLRGTNSLK